MDALLGLLAVREYPRYSAASVGTDQLSADTLRHYVTHAGSRWIRLDIWRRGACCRLLPRWNGSWIHIRNASPL